MKKKSLTYFAYVIMILMLSSLNACQNQMYDPAVDDPLSLKKGGGRPADVDKGDLYGDLVEVERNDSGVPVLYALRYKVDYQDQAVEGYIDVTNPKLNGVFDLTVLVRDEDGFVEMETPTGGGDPIPKTEPATINPGDDKILNLEDDGFSPIVLYDAEGEMLPAVVEHVIPVEQGRLNLIRTTEDVIDRRMKEVIKNFGDGTVADVIRDYCGRLFMLRTEAVRTEGVEDKPIDSPLENMAVYYQLMVYGFSQSAMDNGLLFLVQEEPEIGGFNFQSRLDDRWGEGSFSYDMLVSAEQRDFVANLAAACIAAASDKTDRLIIDEIALVNRFLNIPKAIGNDIDKPAEQVISFLPYVEQEVRMMDKTDKHEYKKYRYYVDYSFFNYNRTKFENTLIDYCTIVGDYDEDSTLIGTHKEVLVADLRLHDILMGDAPLTADANETYVYSQKSNQPTSGALGFANQADDYVQALEVVHNNEEFLVWKLPTPTWDYPGYIPFREDAPFYYTQPEDSHSKKPEGKGDDSTMDKGGEGH
ncbi:hypothetical protein [Sunxiuqinia sp. sy24]|uniref:hypothetical protein n=1 Tax=Sunxiuqinia sp. sy24 TaxID=3461495 RepID=UPI0040452D96